MSKPILFNTEMVKAVLAGKKTQTRRVIKQQPINFADHPKQIWPNQWYFMKDGGKYRCPYGKPGDELWVRETHYLYGHWVKNGFTKTGKQAWTFVRLSPETRFFNTKPDKVKANKFRKIGWYKRPSIFLLQCDSRITLKIKDIRVERVQDISQEDCLAEGISLSDCFIEGAEYSPIVPFINLWNSINEKRGYGWDKNPWGWAIEFKVV